MNVLGSVSERVAHQARSPQSPPAQSIQLSSEKRLGSVTAIVAAVALPPGTRLPGQSRTL
jgi:hypothetical protein